MRLTVYVSIGNSDDKLSQSEWALFVKGTFDALMKHAETMHGDWRSATDSPWQNACWCVEVPLFQVTALRDRLVELAATYQQDSIAWAEVPRTEFLC